MKQADTILLGFPLQFPMNASVRRNDLDVYAKVTDPKGPAMTWGMFAVNYGRLGAAATADSFFQRGWISNILGGFYLWHEVAGGGGASNFITGAGGFIQSVYALYGGMELVNGTLRFVTPRVPPTCSGAG